MMIKRILILLTLLPILSRAQDKITDSDLIGDWKIIQVEVKGEYRYHVKNDSIELIRPVSATDRDTAIDLYKINSIWYKNWRIRFLKNGDAEIVGGEGKPANLGYRITGNIVEILTPVVSEGIPKIAGFIKGGQFNLSLATKDIATILVFTKD